MDTKVVRKCTMEEQLCIFSFRPPFYALGRAPTRIEELDMSVTMDKSVKFWNRKADSYAKQAIAEPAAYEKKLAMTREYLSPESKVLEFGCGTGSTALLHAPYVKHLLAIDNSVRMIEIANEKVQQEGVANVEFRQATLEQLQDPPESFDAILGLNILHLLDDWEAAIRRCFSLLVPGGVFVSGTACIAEESWWLRKLLPLGGAIGVIPRVQIFTRETLENSLKTAGFEILQSVLLNTGGSTPFIIARKEKS